MDKTQRSTLIEECLADLKADWHKMCPVDGYIGDGVYVDDLDDVLREQAEWMVDNGGWPPQKGSQKET